MGQPVYAITNGYIDPTVHLRRGDIWDDADAVVQQHPEHFTDDPYAHGLVQHSGTTPPPGPTGAEGGAAVETATAAPGEKRTRTSPSSRG